MHRLVLVVSYLALTFSAACGRWNFDALVDEDGMVQAGQIDAAAPLAIDAGVGSGIDASMANVCDDALLCSGFESGLLEEWNPVIRLGTAKLTTPQSIAKAGNRSLEVQVFDSMDEGVVGISFAQAFTSGELWVRAWVYVPTAYGSLSSAGIMYLAEVQSPDQYIDVTVTATGVSVFRERSDSGLDIYELAAIDMADQWRCVELNVVLGVTGHLALYVDSDPVADSGVQNMEVQGGGFPHLFVGQSRPVAEVPGSPIYIDEVIVSLTRAGCGAVVPITP